jgi:GNAT superfamily N-acetyltransferase
MTTITRFEPGDFPRWAELWRQYLEFYGTVLPPAQYDHTWTRLGDGRMHGFAARDGSGHIIGLTHYLYHEHGWSTAPSCYLQDLFTDPAARGAGVGRALIAAVAAAARADGADRLYWLTHETNTTARRLYDAVARNSGFLVYRHAL